MDSSPADYRILSIDIGGTGLKAAVIDADGNLLTERVRIKTPQPFRRDALVQAITALVAPLEPLGYIMSPSASLAWSAAASS